MPAAERAESSGGAGRAPAAASQLSDTRTVPIGVFQGSALSCILYLLYDSDLSLCVDEGVSIIQYANAGTCQWQEAGLVYPHRTQGNRTYVSIPLVMFQWNESKCTQNTDDRPWHTIHAPGPASRFGQV